ncbi:nuclear transport factor 2 family protein [Agromyces aerolatus]|uniref:nuclear transport factor 2 family protein n=1 Tax=Agromyces sp. LY-1074 TaxID=3074080 RepID=UPI0028599CCC|nr:MULTISPECIES: nuclear transport factor 2 family protein [unclassified Agromyces]MDR5699122.1 nuclear transport factor 2 family protein [Agromyces sp. LY-1074]MDR5705099.1 nuclear transport factor 2 family protein [Agromyces sp. LY-1358]
MTAVAAGGRTAGAQVSADERNQIEQALAAYCRGLDRFDREVALSPFGEDAVLNYSGIYVGDAPGFMDWVWPFHEKLELNAHRIANVFIERNPSGELVSESYVTSLLRRRDGERFVDRVGYGRYIDRWAETGDGRLVIAEREYVNDLVTEMTNPAETARAVAPVDGVPAFAASRGPDDASYRLLAGAGVPASAVRAGR